MLLTIIAFIAVLFVLVMVHEFGHFITAKKTGMDVEEFAFGFPPRLFSFKKGGTNYSINLLPLGGYVKIRGENGDDDGHDAFTNKPIRSRILTLAAGVVMNMLLAWVLLSSTLVIGMPQAKADYNSTAKRSHQQVVISDVLSGSPADKAGIKAGDVVLSLDGNQIDTAQQVQDYTKSHANISVQYVLERDKKDITIQATPEVLASTGQPGIGVGLVEVVNVKYPIYLAPIKGAELTWDYTKLTVGGFYGIIKQLFQGHKVTDQLTGPIGIASMTGQFARMGIASLLQFTAVLSINLAIINALPIPALDGGRILFVLVEAIRGKKIRSKVEQYSHAFGFVLLITLMIVITYHDIVSRLSH